MFLLETSGLDLPGGLHPVLLRLFSDHLANLLVQVAHSLWGLRVGRKFMLEVALRFSMGREHWVVVVADGARFLGRFPFRSQPQAERFVGSATRQGFRAKVEGGPETIAPPPAERARNTARPDNRRMADKTRFVGLPSLSGSGRGK